MSLKVWLPLNGNFENKGLGTLSTNFVPNNIIYENGKIGINPVFAANYTNYATCNELVNKDNNFSIAFWIKATDNQTFTTWSDVFNASDFRLEFNSTAGTAINLFGFGYDNSGLGGITINKKWHHITYTYQNNTFTGYLDGIQKVKRTVQTAGKVWSGKFRLGDSANSYFQLADFRIYDECLSQKQIKEIAKGLVCHYKFDGTKANENLISKSYTSSWAANGTNTFTKLDDYSFSIEYTTETVGSSNGRYKSINNYFIEGKTYTFSYDIKGNGEYKMKCGFESNANFITTSTNFKRYYCTYTASSTGWKAIVFYADNNNNLTIGSIITIKNMKLEEGTNATRWIPASTDPEYITWGYDKIFKQDCSGYNYIGIQYGTLTYSLDSPKYDGSTSFNNGYLHYLPSPLHSMTDSFTIMTWFYPTQNATMALYNNRTAVGLGVAVFYISGKIRFDTGEGIHQTTFNNSTLTVNAWNHIAVTYERGVAKKCYLNGILVGTETTNVGDLSHIGTNASIGNSSTNAAAGAGNQIYGSLSDFRIYATALSAEEILTLYKNSGIIDNNNSVYTREFKEV